MYAQLPPKEIAIAQYKQSAEAAQQRATQAGPPPLVTTPIPYSLLPV